MKRKTEWVNFRVSPEERIAIKRNARKEGKYMGELIRERCIKPFKECPHFDTCSRNLCPLDPNITKRFKPIEDERCRAWKSTRRKIGEQYPDLLPHKGLTAREAAGHKLSPKLSTKDENKG